MTKTMQGAYARAKEVVERNIVNNAEVSLDDVIAWVTGAVIRYAQDKPEPTGDKQEIIPPPAKPKIDGTANIHERGPTALGGPENVLRDQSKAAGYTGDICSECGNLTMVRNGTCLKCMTCGSTSGCS